MIVIGMFIFIPNIFFVNILFSSNPKVSSPTIAPATTE